MDYKKKITAKKRKVSVIVPIYNCEQFIGEAVSSVLSQTYEDFELLIIDDCSTDNSLKIVKDFVDSRIIIIQKEKNTGYTDSLNYGISIANGEYIARMDGDDICLPKRFEKQVAFLDNNPSVILCGTSIQIIGSNKIIRHPSKHEDIVIKLCFGNSFCHPSVMGRKEMFLENMYDKNFEPAEDYELWTRLAAKEELANLDEVLLFYRVHKNQISNTQANIQFEKTFDCKLRMFSKFNPYVNFTDSQIKIALGMHKPNTLSDCEIGLDWIKYLLFKNQISNIFEKDKFKKRLYKFKIDFLRSYFSKNNILRVDSFIFFFKHTSIKEFYFISRISKIIKKHFK